MITWGSTNPSTILLAPPSPPGAPHLGGVYTWSLLDAARRTAQHLGGTAQLPQSWNMSSRRLEPRFGDNPAGFADYCSSSVNSAVAAMNTFGVTMSPDTALRDDHTAIRAHVQATIGDLAHTGVIRYLAACQRSAKTDPVVIREN